MSVDRLRRPFLQVAAVSLSIRLAYLLAFRNSPLFDVYAVDHLYYRTWGRAIADGKELEDIFEQGPLYAYLLGWFYRLGWGDLSVLCAQLLVGVLGSLLVCAAGRRLFGSAAGLAAGLLAAVYGPLVFYEAMLMKSALAAPLSALALYCAVRYSDDRRARWLVVAGAAIGLLCLKREIHATLLVPFLVLVWRPGSGQGRGLPRLLGQSLALLGVFALALAPAVAHNMRHGSVPAVTSLGGEVFYKAFGPFATAFGTDPPFVRSFVWTEHQDFRDQAMFLAGRVLTRAETSRFWFDQGVRAVLDDPFRVLRLEGQKLALLYKDFEVPDTEYFVATREWIPLLRFLPGFGWIFGLAVAGAGLGLRSGRGMSVPLWFLAVQTFNILITHNLGRYRLGLVVVVLLLAGNGLAGILAALLSGAGPRRRGALIWAGVALSCSAAAFLPLPQTQRAFWERSEAGFRQDRIERAGTRDAVAPLRSALALDPSDTSIRYRLGYALEHSGKLPEAEAEYTGVLKAAPGDANTRWRLSQLLQTQGRVVAAIACLEPLVAARSDSYELRLAAGILQARMATDPASVDREDHLARAMEHFATASHLRLDAADPLFNLGRLLFLSGRHREAAQALAGALERVPDFPEARFLLDRLEKTR